MNIRHLQLNTRLLKNPKAVMQFIVDNDIHIACLQEIVYQTDEQNPLKELIQENTYNYVEGINYYLKPENKTIAEAIVTSFDIIDINLNYYNTENFHPKNLDKTNLLNIDILNDHNKLDFPNSRAVKHWNKSRCIINTLLHTQKGYIRVLNSHNNVSSKCTETIHMLKMAELINSIITYSKQYPTIYSADLNIQPQSYSIAKISEVMTCHTKDFTDTLSSEHIAKKNDAPEGLAVDHVFSKNLKHISTKSKEVDFSDHKALFSEFALG